MRVLAISGSLRQHSYNGALLAAAAAYCPPNVHFALWRGLADVPPFNEDVDAPPSVLSLRRVIVEADAVLIATPEYNASVPGVLKNALDWASLPFPANALRDKPVAVIGASKGLFGAVWAQAELRKILAATGARVDDRELPVARAHEAFTADGRLRDAHLASTLEAIVTDLTAGETRCAA
jgi:chromate reductase, NAD(P)H dehydrogenase (quinone)